MSKTRTYAGKPLGDTEYLLEQWGWWVWDGRGAPGYTSQMGAIMNLANPTHKSKVYSITDEVAALIDKAVARLLIRDHQMGHFLWCYFGEKYPANRIARENQMSERKAWELIKAGVAWVDGSLDNQLDVA